MSSAPDVLPAPPALRFPALDTPALERAQLALLVGTAATGVLSIFAGQLGLTLAVLVFLVRLFTGRARLTATAVDAPMLALAVWTMLSASFSPDPAASHRGVKQLVLFALFHVAVDSLTDEDRRERLLDGLLLGGLVLGTGALLQYVFLGYRDNDHRPHSFLGHYMTMSGLCMGTAVLAAARWLFPSFPGARPRPGRRDLAALGVLGAAFAVHTAARGLDVFGVEVERLFVAGVAATALGLALGRTPWPDGGTRTLLTILAFTACTGGLLVSRTRNAWLGVIVGLGILALLRAPRLLWLLAGGIVVALLLPPVQERLKWDPSSTDRTMMWAAGTEMIRDKPVFGQGPQMILRVYPAYRLPDAPNAAAPHLHDNVMQVAAERGIPGLIWWLWWMAAILAAAFQAARRPNPGWAGPAAFAVLAALMTGGLFEYNFGDSEVLMFLLIVSALPFALRRTSAAA